MPTIQSILNKISSLTSRTGKFSIQKNEFFGLLTDMTNKVKEVNDNVNSVAKSLIWQAPVANFAALATSYPTPVIGWAAMVTSLGFVYSWNGTEWKDTGLNSFPSDVAIKSEVSFKSELNDINKSNELVNDGGPIAIFLANNKPAEKSGFISEMEILSYDEGIANFTIMKRNTFLYPTLSGGNREVFGRIKDFTIDVSVGRKIYILTDKIWINRGEFIGQAYNGGVRTVRTTLPEPCGWWQGGADAISNNGTELIYQVGSVGFSYTIQSPKYIIKPYITDIIATRNINDFNSIRELMVSISDATDEHQVRIIVPEGEWRECDIIGKQNVIIEGAGIDKTIIYNDGTNSELRVPSDYSFTQYGNLFLSSIPQQYKHVVRAQYPVNMKNLTLRANEVKYCVHGDADIQNDVIEFDNVKFLSLENVNDCVGLGLHGMSVGQKALFDKCIFQSMHSDKYGIFMHNCNNQLKSVELTIKNSRFNNCQTLQLNELGSDQEDHVNLLNCFSDGGGSITYGVDGSGDNTYWINPATGLVEPNPTIVPYNLKLNTLGSNINNFKISVFGGAMKVVSRPDWHKCVNTDYFSISKTNSAITKGALIGGMKFGDSIFAQNYNGSFPVLGIALTSLTNGEVKIIERGKFSYASVSGVFSNYVKIQGNILVFTNDSTQAIGYVISNVTEDGLYPLIIY